MAVTAPCSCNMGHMMVTAWNGVEDEVEMVVADKR